MVASSSSATQPPGAPSKPSPSLYGQATAQAWDQPHPRLTQRTAWTDHEEPLPIIEGTFRLTVDRLPSGGDPKPVWLWWSEVDASDADIDRCWHMFVRRFDIEHTFRLLKQTLRWTWLMITVHARLRLARPLAIDLRRPREKPVEPERLTTARVRRGFQNIRATPIPARALKP
ncbi:transposase, partial [Kibdelosporangium lantanae]